MFRLPTIGKLAAALELLPTLLAASLLLLAQARDEDWILYAALSTTFMSGGGWLILGDHGGALRAWSGRAVAGTALALLALVTAAFDVSGVAFTVVGTVALYFVLFAMPVFFALELMRQQAEQVAEEGRLQLRSRARRQSNLARKRW